MSTENEMIAEMELDQVKQDLTLMNVKFPANAKLETLKALRAKALEKQEEKEEPKAKVSPGAAKAKAMELVKVKVMNHHPERTDWQGETIAVGNSIIGMHSVFVPYQAEWCELPRIAIDTLKERKYRVTRKSHKPANMYGADMRNDFEKEFTIIEL